MSPWAPAGAAGGAEGAGGGGADEQFAARGGVQREGGAVGQAELGERALDDALARARIAQAFGRLIRRADDRGVFVMLDAAAPTRLFASLPPGTEVQRMGLADAVELTRSFLNPEAT